MCADVAVENIRTEDGVQWMGTKHWPLERRLSSYLLLLSDPSHVNIISTKIFMTIHFCLWTYLSEVQLQLPEDHLQLVDFAS